MREPLQKWEEFGHRPWPYDALKSGDLQGALNGFALREMLDYRDWGRHHADGWICGFGVVQWLMGDRAGAARVWSRMCDECVRGKIKYSSTGTLQPGLLLWFASVWLKDEDWREEAAALFEKLLRRKVPLMSGRFELVLAKLLRREVTLEQVRTVYTDMRKPDRDCAERKALFYAGVRAYDEGRVEETRRLWSQVPEPSEREGELEYHLLAYERKRLSL